MEALGLNYFDAAALAIVAVSGIMAFARGLLREVFSIVAFIGAGIAAIYGRGLVTPIVDGIFQPPILGEIVAAGVIFLVVFILITIATSLVAKAVHQSTEIGALDRAAGLVFGIARAVLVLALFVLLMRHITGAPQAPMPNWLTQARSYPILNQAAVALETVIPQTRAYINEKSGPDSPDGGSASPQG
jgi:membrane protein required for colicin V production